MRNLYVVHDSSEVVKCSFLTFVVRTKSIDTKFPGGLKAFAEKHGPRCNNDLAVICAMNGNELEPVLQDLQDHAFDKGDALFFDAASYLLAASMTGEYGQIEFCTPWLKSECTQEGFFVTYNESQERSL